MSFASESSVKAVRKRHVCDGCGKFINVGSPATRWAGLTDGDFGTAIYHPECRVAETAYNVDLLDYQWGDDWYPLTEMDSDDWPWLIEKYPAIAARMGIARPAESSPSDMAAAGGLPPLSAHDDPLNPIPFDQGNSSSSVQIEPPIGLAHKAEGRESND